jgi:hypothetical protein
MSMRHNQHIIRLALGSLPARILAKLLLVILFPQVANQLVKPPTHVLGRLAALAAVAPYVPVFIEPLGFAFGAYVGADFAFIVAVVPFADGVGDLDVRVCAGVEG